MESSPVFVLITAENCGHCKTLKNNPEGWPAIEQELNSLRGVRVIKVDLAQTNSKVDADKFPADLNRYLQWFPSAVMFSGSNWNEAIANLKMGTPVKLHGMVLNGELDATGVPRYKPGKYSLKKGSTLEWVRETMGSLASSAPGAPGGPASWSPVPGGLGGSAPGPQPLVPGSFGTPKTAANSGPPRTIYVPTTATADVCRMHMVPKNR